MAQTHYEFALNDPSLSLFQIHRTEYLKSRGEEGARVFLKALIQLTYNLLTFNLTLEGISLTKLHEGIKGGGWVSRNRRIKAKIQF